MKLSTPFFSAALMCSVAFAAAPATDPNIPHLQKKGTATQLIVDGKPFLMLAGELSNNSATSLEYMKPIWANMAAAKFNTALVGVSWNQIEPQEGKFDFKMVDAALEGARAQNLHVALLWFGSWKNSLSSYAPDWVKKDFERFPRAQFENFKSIEELSTLSENNWQADAKAFAALMKHVKEIDGQKHTVIFIQVENEVSMHTITCDRSELAAKAYAQPVPKELMDYLQAHKDTLIPEFRAYWGANGFKTSGTWEEAFGKGPGTEGIFMSWNYSRYMGHVADAGKAEYPIPMYANAAMYNIVKGQFTPARGRPWDLVMDVWHCGGPSIDVISPDIYTLGDFVGFCAKYTQNGNPLLIPETSSGAGVTARAIFAFCRYDAICFSPFGVDRASPSSELTSAYTLLGQLSPMILAHQGDGTMSAIMFNAGDPEQKVTVGNYTMLVTAPRGGRGGAAASAPAAAATPLYALFIQTGPDEYYMVGNGVTVTFASTKAGAPLAGMGTVEEGAFVNGKWTPGRLLAGDDTSQGDILNLRNNNITRVTLYSYR